MQLHHNELWCDHVVCIWLYPNQAAKLGSWFLLMIVSTMLVTLVSRPEPMEAVPVSDPAAPGTVAGPIS